MRLAIEHRTRYRFSAPQARLVQMLRLTPEDTHDQTVAGWDIDVDCDARMRPARDGFGNRVTMLYVEGPIAAIEIAVSGQVLTNPTNGVVHGAGEPLPPALFLRATALTQADAAIAAFAQAIAPGDALDRLHRLNHAVCARFALARARPVQGRPAADAFALDTATPRDLAQIFIAAARQLGAPARYVSGYWPVGEEGGAQSTPHGWAEAHVAGLGWVTFDPSTGRSANESYVRVAVALDSAGAAPVAGSRLGEGDEQLDVDVSVAEADDAET